MTADELAEAIRYAPCLEDPPPWRYKTTGRPRCDATPGMLHHRCAAEAALEALAGERGRIVAAMDDVLIPAGDGRGVDLGRLRLLPPWRAVMLARVLVKVTPPVLSYADLEELERDAQRVGGDGRLPGARR